MGSTDGGLYKKQLCINEITGREDEQVADGGGEDGKVGARFNATNASWALQPSGCHGVWLAGYRLSHRVQALAFDCRRLVRYYADTPFYVFRDTRSTRWYVLVAFLG